MMTKIGRRKKRFICYNTWQVTTSGDKKKETWNRCIVAIKIKIIEYIRNENKFRVVDNENCLALIFEVLSRTFFIVRKKLNLIFKGKELFIFATAYQTRILT